MLHIYIYTRLTNKIPGASTYIYVFDFSVSPRLPNILVPGGEPIASPTGKLRTYIRVAFFNLQSRKVNDHVGTRTHTHHHTMLSEADDRVALQLGALLRLKNVSKVLDFPVEFVARVSTFDPGETNVTKSARFDE